ncbi:hypothetical protein [Pedobacter sp.]|jgi:hypothetical protein|uniref:hypothetical protein n=1 Tax=Pedobacter sp. TaxID=1411316 RepID=UPI002BFCD57E|nr:hypothetical protein [Pedobacter sp.]HWW39642.1 hypothetical protein [Pedobacter sp.]
MAATTTITSILREFNLTPNIVGIVTTANLATITAAGYVTNEDANIQLLNNGEFQWLPSDIVLIYYSPNQIGFFTYDPVNFTFIELAPSSGLSDSLPSGNIFVGNASNIATGVAVTGILSITNAGVTSIPLTSAHILVGNGSGVAANVAMSGIVAITNAGVTSIPLASADLLVGSSGGVAAPVALSGDGTLSNTGVLTIGAGAITGSKIANNAVDYAQLALDVAATATVTLTATQIKALYDTPVQLIAAPGAGKLILIDNILWDIAFVTTQYTAGGVLAAQYGNTVHGAGPVASGTLAAASLNGVAASGFLSNGGIAGSLSVTATASLNTAVYLSNATQDFATGDSTAILYVRYRIVTPA